jgi:hypothetical protein
MAVAEELEDAVLRKHCNLIVHGAVLEPEERLRRHPVATNYAGSVSHGNYLAVRGAQFEKAVNRSL